MPNLWEFYPGICLTIEEKVQKNLSQGKRNLSQGKKISVRVQYILPKDPHITKPIHTHTLTLTHSTMRIFMTFDDFGFFENLSRKFKDDLNVARVTVLYMKTCLHL